MENPIQNALAFAVAQHGGQTRKGSSSIAYTHHLAEVSALVAAFGGETDVIAAAWLHDVVEDTDASIDQIAEKFGAVISGLVKEVTDDPEMSKTEQRAAQISHAPNLSVGAALIKAADQTSNVNGLVGISTELGLREARAVYPQGRSGGGRFADSRRIATSL